MTKLNPLTAHYQDAGFAGGADARIAKSRKAEQRLRERAIREATRNPEVSTRVLNALPHEFVDKAVRRLECCLLHGEWDKAHAAIDDLKTEWAEEAAQRPTTVRFFRFAKSDGAGLWAMTGEHRGIFFHGNGYETCAPAWSLSDLSSGTVGLGLAVEELTAAQALVHLCYWPAAQAELKKIIARHPSPEARP